MLFFISVIKGGWVERSGRETEKREEAKQGNIADDLCIHVLCYYPSMSAKGESPQDWHGQGHDT